MAGSLNQPRRVQDDGPRSCKLLLDGSKGSFVNRGEYMVPEKEAAPCAAPAAVILEGRVVLICIGCRGGVGGGM